jgi:hypothetical protein
MGRASGRKRDKPVLKRANHEGKPGLIATVRGWFQQNALGIGVTLAGPLAPLVGFDRPEIKPFSVLIGLTIIAWKLNDNERVRMWREGKPPFIRRAVVGAVAVIILAASGGVWILSGRSISSSRISALLPTFNSRQELRVASRGGACPDCPDSIDLDGAGTLFIKMGDLGSVELGLTESTVYEIENPLPGVVKLPPTERSKQPQPTDSGKDVTPPTLDIRTVTVPPGVFAARQKWTTSALDR